MNKETAFAEGRRTAVALHGLLPPHVSTLDEQVDRMLRVVRKFETHLERYLFLRELQDSNEILFLRELYPKVHVSLHAGGLAPCVVPPEGLCCHVRRAVEQARTHRIGHGTDVMYEDDPAALMADKGVLVEINLTSNADVLGVSGKDHPFPIYRKFAVPVALSTDDEGIERIDLTNEYVRAVETYDLTYADLKQIVRNGLEYDFLPGASLWDGSAFQRIVSNCRGDALGAATPSPLRRLSQGERHHRRGPHSRSLSQHDR